MCDYIAREPQERKDEENCNDNHDNREASDDNDNDEDPKDHDDGRERQKRDDQSNHFLYLWYIHIKLIVLSLT